MVKIPTYARQHVSQAVGTPGVDPNAGREAEAISKIAGQLGEVVAKQKDIADQANASKLSSQASIDLEKQTTELRTLHANDPELLATETQKAYQEYYTRTSEGISNPEIRNKYLAQGNSAMATATVGNMRWSVKTLAVKAKADFEESRLGARVGLGSATDADGFVRGARSYAANNKDLYNTVYGAEGAAKLKKDWSEGAERFMQGQVAQNPFKAFQELESGKLDNFMTTAEKQKWTTRAKDGINTWNKGLVTKAKSSAVVRGSTLGAKVIEGSFTVADVEREFNRVKGDPNISDQYKNGLEKWAEQLYKGEGPSLVNQLDSFDGLDKELTDLTKALKAQPDKYFDSVLAFKARVQDMFNNKKITNAAFKELYSTTILLQDEAAGKLDAVIDRPWTLDNTLLVEVDKSYTRMDNFMVNTINANIFSQTPKGFKDRVGVGMKTDYSRAVMLRKAKVGRELTTREHKQAADAAMRNATRTINDSVLAQGKLEGDI